MKNIKIIFALLVIAASISGCASSSGALPIGPDTYMMSKEAGTGFSGINSLRTDIIREAGQHCATESKTMQIVSISNNAGPYILGNYPRAEIQYMCLAKGDPELQRPKLRKEADTVIEIRK